MAKQKALAVPKRQSWAAKLQLKKQWPYYVMILPGVIFIVMFKLIPLLSCVIAFQDYSLTKGIAGSEWVGLEHFVKMFTYQDISRVLWNTVVLAFYSLIIVFPVPIIFALMLNELRGKLFKGAVQTISYLPYLFSWVIIAGLTFTLLSSDGLFNSVREMLGLERLLVLQNEKYFRLIIVITTIWKETGWSSIVVLAAIAGINPEYYEAAVVDGASRIKQIWYITLPLLMPTIVTLFLLRIGNFLDLGFDQIYNFLTPMTYRVGDVIATYVYRVGITEGQYSLTTAVGLFQSIIGLALVTICNKLSNKFTGGGLW